MNRGEQDGASGLVSVAVATFNGARFVAEQLRSILAQELPLRLEVVVSDDGSTDETVQICRELAAQDRRLRVLEPSLRRLGVGGNFERAIAATTGDFVALSDQDDVWDAEKLATLLDALRTTPAAELAFCDMRIVREDGQAIAGSFTRNQRMDPRKPAALTLRRLLVRNVVTGCALMVRRSLVDAALPFPAGCQYHDWWIAVVAASRGRLLFVDRSLQNYRQHGGNVVGARQLGLSQVVPLLRSSPAAAPEGTPDFDVSRLDRYHQRSDVFADEQARADLEFASAFFRALSDPRRLGFRGRMSLLRDRLRYRTRATARDRLVAVASTLAPTMTRALARFVVRCTDPWCRSSD